MSPTEYQNTFQGIPAQTAFNSNGREHSNGVAEGIDRVGHRLTAPMSWCIDKFSRIFALDLKPGHWGQKQTKREEVAYRVVLFAATVIATICALVPLIPGVLLRVAASSSKKDFVWARPEGQTAKDKGTPKRLVFVTYNALLGPECQVRRNMCRPTHERVHEVQEAISKASQKQLKSEPDVICMQEVFHTEAAEELRKDYLKKGYQVIYNIGPQSMGLNSGLFVAVKNKYALSDIRFYPHPVNKAGFDKYANKGLLLLTMQVGNQKIMIGNTHLNGGGTTADGHRAYVSRAAEQIAILNHLKQYKLEHLENDDPIKQVFLLADTNISPTFYEDREDRDARRSKKADHSPEPLQPNLEQEWQLCEELDRHSDEELAIPSAANILKPSAWRKFNNKMKQIKEDFEKKQDQSVKDLGLEKYLEHNGREPRGGPFSRTAFWNDINGHARAVLGSTKDMDYSKEMGFGNGTQSQPERVDFIFVQADSPHLPKPENVHVMNVVNSKGQLVSDHDAVGAVLEV